MKAEDQKTIDHFITDMGRIVDDLENYSGYLELSPDANKVKEQALEILRKKVRKLQKAEDISDVKKVIKVNKLLGRK